jgi:hypothetical protein
MTGDNMTEQEVSCGNAMALVASFSASKPAIASPNICIRKWGL